MAKYYTLLSGEKINLNSLKKDERKHIKSLEQCISGCRNHDKEDYLNVMREADVLTPGRWYTARTLQEVRNTAHYKIAIDLDKRYWYKCFNKEPKFYEYIRRERLEEEYSRYREQSDTILEMMDKAAAKVGLYAERQNTKRPILRNKKPKRKKRTAPP